MTSIMLGLGYYVGDSHSILTTRYCLVLVLVHSCMQVEHFNCKQFVSRNAFLKKLYDVQILIILCISVFKKDCFTKVIYLKSRCRVFL